MCSQCPLLAPFGGLLGSVMVGAASGGVAGGLGEALTQVGLYGKVRNPQLIGAAMLSGVASGGVFGGVGWRIRVGRFVGYHGTSSVHEASIRQGINPPTGANFRGGAQLGEGFYTTVDREAAEYFARVATSKAGGQPTVLRVFARGFGRMSGTSVPESLWWRTPTSYVTNYDYLTAPISGLEHWSQIKFNPSVYNFLTALR